MYCSECRFFSDLGRCRNGAARRGDVGYFQKACALYEGLCLPERETPVIEQKVAEIEQKQPIIVQKPMEKVQTEIGTKVCSRCGKAKPYLDFRHNTKGERISVCKECMTESRKAGKSRKADESRPIERKDLTKEDFAEIITYLTDEGLARELARRGYSGKLVKHTELNV